MSATEVWKEPLRGGYPHPGVLGLSGLERLRRFRSLGSPAPPLSHLTGAEPVRFGEGTAEAVMPASPWLCNSAGLAYGVWSESGYSNVAPSPYVTPAK
jgi:hypothetical protein